MALSTFRRYELKFKLTEEQFSALYPKIVKEMQIDKYCLGGRHYNVHNIYYDTKDSALIRASIAKPGYKEKLRLRSYTLPRSADDAVFLELKKKTAHPGQRKLYRRAGGAGNQLVFEPQSGCSGRLCGI
jgi:hypothetical protein